MSESDLENSRKGGHDQLGAVPQKEINSTFSTISFLWNSSQLAMASLFVSFLDRSQTHETSFDTVNISAEIHPYNLLYFTGIAQSL